MGSKRALQFCALLLIALGCFLRFYQIDEKVVWHDELLSASRAAGFAHYEQALSAYLQLRPLPQAATELSELFEVVPRGDYLTVVTSVLNFPQVPLYYLLARVWGDFFGHGVSSLRYFSAVLGVLAVFALFVFALTIRRRLELPVIFPYVLTALVAISPSQIVLSQEARMYSLLLFVSILALTTFFQWVENRSLSRTLLLFSVCLIGVLTHLLFCVLIGGFVIFLSCTEEGKFSFSRAKISFSMMALLAVLLISLRSFYGQQAFEHFSAIPLPEGHLLPTAVSTFTSGFSFVQLGSFGNALELQPYLTNAQFNPLAIAFLLMILSVSLAPICQFNSWLMFIAVAWGPFVVFVSLDALLGGQRVAVMRYYTLSHLAAHILFAAALAKLLASGSIGKARVALVNANLFLVVLMGGASAYFSGQSPAYYKFGPDVAHLESLAGFLNSKEQAKVLHLVRAKTLLPIAHRLNESVSIDSLMRAVNSRELQSRYLGDLCAGASGVFLLRPANAPQREFLARFGLQETAVMEGEAIVLGRLEQNCS